MPDLDHAALEAAARAATQGEWHYDRKDPVGQAVVSNEHIELMTFWHHSVGAIEKEMEANAAYIVAAQPSVILALLEERKRLVEERDEALCVAEGPSTLIDLARGSVERGFALHAAETERDRMKAALSIISKNYANQDISHHDYRVNAAQTADAALAGEKEPTK